MVCDGADGCRKAVREQLSYGTDWVKIYANTGGLRMTADGYIDSPPNWTKEEIEAVVSEAHAKGVKVAAHARSDTGLRIAIAAGVDSIEHGDSIRPEAAQEMARKGIFLVPTLVVADYVAGPRTAAGCAVCAHTEKAHAKSFDNCRKAGVKIAFGTDAGGFPWTEINQAKEFEFEVKLGMTPIEAIRSRHDGRGGAPRHDRPGRQRSSRARSPTRRGRRRSARRRRRPSPEIDFVMKGGEIVRSPAPRAMAATAAARGKSAGRKSRAPCCASASPAAWPRASRPSPRCSSELGAAVLDADEIVRALYREGGAGAEAARKLFGDAVTGPDGRVDRVRIAALVFGDPAARHALEASIHPLVRAESATVLRRGRAPRRRRSPSSRLRSFSRRGPSPTTTASCSSWRRRRSACAAGGRRAATPRTRGGASPRRSGEEAARERVHDVIWNGGSREDAAPESRGALPALDGINSAACLRRN